MYETQNCDTLLGNDSLFTLYLLTFSINAVVQIATNARKSADFVIHLIINSLNSKELKELMFSTHERQSMACKV